MQVSVNELRLYIAKSKRFLQVCILYIILLYSCSLHISYFNAFQWAASPKIAPSSPVGLGLKTWFIGPTRVHNPNGISIGSAVL